MKFKSVYVNNFKSLVDFRIAFSDFNCLIGLNGSGKSTFLQFVSFLSQLMRGDMNDWLRERKWTKQDIFTQTECFEQWEGNDRLVHFEIHLACDNTDCVWEAKIDEQLRCIYERIQIGEQEFMSHNHDGKKFYQINGKEKPIYFAYTGSILSVLEDSEVPEVFNQFRNNVRNINSVDLLSPQLLRRRAKESFGTIGTGGEHLSPFLFEKGDDFRESIRKKLLSHYPQLKNITVRSLRSGWKQLEITESFGDACNLKTESRHINDGLLRMIAFFAQLQTESNIVLFDEIENGINQELIEFLVNALLASSQKSQIVVTTHSPLLLNYLEDETAKSAVHFFYKNAAGQTQCVPFFSVPRIAEKLKTLGPGEALADTDLVKLAQEIEHGGAE